MSSKFGRLAILALAQGGILKILQHPASVAAFDRAGMPNAAMPLIGAAELLLLAFCLIPRTTLAGAALFTLYLVAATAAGILTRIDFVLDLALIPVIWLGPALGAGLFCPVAHAQGVPCRDSSRHLHEL